MLEQGKWKKEAPKPSREFHERFEESLKMIEDIAEKQNQKKVSKAEIMDMTHRRKRTGRLKRVTAGLTAAAAAMAVFAGVCYQNPVWASNLPLIGHIFERMEEKLPYGEDYKDYAKPLGDNQGESQDGENSGAFTRTVDGTTVTLSEIYCSGSALYVSMLIESETPFPDTLIAQWGSPVVNVTTEENYSFNPKAQIGQYIAEGEFTDDNTYAGVIRIDLNERNIDDSLLSQKLAEAEANGEEFIYDQKVMDEYGVKAVEIPDEFTVELNISRIVGDLANPEELDTGHTPEELEAMPEEEWQAVMNEAYSKGDWGQYPNKHENWWRDGSWNFALDVSVDKSKMQTAEVNQMNEDGAGVESVTKTPFEITVNEQYAEGVPREEYFPVIVDAKGNVMDETGSAGSANTVSVKNHDISTIYVYLCDYTEYMDELKSHKEEEGFKELMDEKAKFAAEVHFD